MSMTHKEALKEAVKKWLCEDDVDGFVTEAIDSGSVSWVLDAEAAIRAYIEARGLVLVPEGEWVSHESALAAINYLNRTKDPHRAIKSARMLAYAPDPFKAGAA